MVSELCLNELMFKSWSYNKKRVSRYKLIISIVYIKTEKRCLFCNRMWFNASYKAKLFHETLLFFLNLTLYCLF